MKLRDILLKENNESCPAATQDLMLNTKNRDAATKKYFWSKENFIELIPKQRPIIVNKLGRINLVFFEETRLKGFFFSILFNCY